MLLLISWMSVGDWEHDPLETWGPAQWDDWVASVDRVIADRAP
jgi:hypothetical protein